MSKKNYALKNCRIEVIDEKGRFVGIGKISIGRTALRSGRLPITAYSETFTGYELIEQRLLGVDVSDNEIRVRTEARFAPSRVKMMRDHSFDPIHTLHDWDRPELKTALLDIVFRPASETIDGTTLEGFSYHYDYRSTDVPIFYLFESASWELDGDAEGATVINQSACSSPMVTFAPDTAWTTEGVMHWDPKADNPIMTHNLPRWASHQAFDFQYKGNKTLVGLFDRLDLIRTVIMREAGKPELKCFDKHIFDQTLQYTTSAKKILLNVEKKTPTAQKNLWTRIFDEAHNRARAEVGLAEEPLIPRVYGEFFLPTPRYEDYYVHLLPVAKKLGFKAVYLLNVNKCAFSEQSPHRTWTWNTCCGHEYEPAPMYGGTEGLKTMIEQFKEAGIRVNSWTNNDQALSSPLNKPERNDGRGWYIYLEDTRQKWGGAYMGCMSVFNFNNADARNYWINALKKIKAETGLDQYHFDSFYNLAFFPVNFDHSRPTTQWRSLLAAFKELQDAGINFLIESFGAFGMPAHGCPTSYGDADKLFAAYKLQIALGYATIGGGEGQKVQHDIDMVYRYFAHMVSPGVNVTHGKQRLDEIWDDRHIRALADYNENRQHMAKRFLQEDDLSVLWHDANATRATLWNFADRERKLSGKVHDLSAAQDLPPAKKYHLQARHTYAITAAPLPTTV